AYESGRRRKRFCRWDDIGGMQQAPPLKAKAPLGNADGDAMLVEDRFAGGGDRARRWPFGRLRIGWLPGLPEHGRLFEVDHRRGNQVQLREAVLGVEVL